MTPWVNNGAPIDVVIVEDHDDYRNGLEFFLQASGHIQCRSFPELTVAMAQMTNRRPDIVVMDIHLPGTDGIEGTRIIKDRWPDVQVLICTVHEDDEKIFNALRAGASGYLLKRTSIEDVVEAIRQIRAGGSPMSPAIARRVVNSFRPPKFNEGPDALSEREQEVLDLLTKGHRVKDIAEKLFVSVNTVRTHIRHIYEKLHVQSRVEAVNKVNGKGG